MKRSDLLKAAFLFVFSQLLNSCSSNDLRTGLIAHYPFTSGAFDSSGHANDGSAIGVAPAADFSGIEGGACGFDGRRSRIVLPDGLIEQSVSRSVTLWFKTTAGGVMLGYQSSHYPDYPPKSYVPAMYVGLDGVAYAEFWNGAKNPMRSTTKVNDGRWHFMALIGDSLEQKLILDGAVVGEMSGAVSRLGMTKNQIGIGNTGVGNQDGWPGGNDQWFGFEGTLDNVRIYDRTLSVAQCVELFRRKE